jgi:hypothetical protein
VDGINNMNANELADHLEKYFDSEPYCDEVVTMLHQQQAEIDSLRKNLDVALMMIDDLEKGLDSSINLNKAQAERQVKELTDEEILDLASYAGENPTKYDMIDFARAILRKAQEK